MAWNKVPKPAESSVTSQTFGDGTPLGVLMAITVSSVTTSTSVVSGWTDIAKPTSSVWTMIAKPST